MPGLVHTSGSGVQGGDLDGELDRPGPVAGVALTGSRTRQAASLLSDVDTALQRAKHRGGGIYELFDETVRAQPIERLSWSRPCLFARPDTASRVGELLGHDRRWQ